jgi:hypothetical protein
MNITNSIVRRQYSDFVDHDLFKTTALKWLLDRYNSYPINDGVFIKWNAVPSNIRSLIVVPYGCWDFQLLLRETDDFIVISYSYRPAPTHDLDYSVFGLPKYFKEPQVYEVVVVLPDDYVAIEMLFNIQ